MKFIADYAAIKSALQLGIGATEKKTVLPVTTHARLETLDDETLQVAMTDLDMTVIVAVPAVTASRGGCTVEAAALLDIAKNTDDALSCELASNMRLKVTTGTASYELPAMPLDYFPPLPMLDDGEDLALSFGDFLPMLSCIDYAMSPDNHGRDSFHGVCLTVTRQRVDAFALDGYRFALASLPGRFGAECKLLLPHKLVRAIPKFTLKTGGEFTISLGWNANHVGSIHDNVQLIARREDVGFHDYASSVPGIRKSSAFEVNTKGIIAALSRAILFSGTDNRGVHMIVRPGEVRIEPRTPNDRGSASDATQTNYTGDEARVAVSGTRLLDALRSISTELTSIDFGDPAAENGVAGNMFVRPVDSERSFSVVHMIARMTL